jgi:dihydroxyacetone kinase-like protein
LAASFHFTKQYRPCRREPSARQLILTKPAAALGSGALRRIVEIQKPPFGDGEMEMGVGIHGEPGRRRVALKSADAIAKEMGEAILGDLREQARGDALLLVNGFGGTPLMELYLMYHAAQKVISGAGVRVARSLVGNYVTSLDMAGCSITLCMLTDELKRLWDAPVHTAALRWGM